MKTQLTDKTWVVTTKQLGRFWINEKQAQNVKQLLQSGGQGFVDIGDNMIRVEDINGVVTGEAIETTDHQKKGEWKCKYNFWHERGQGCGHGMLRK